MTTPSRVGAFLLAFGCLAGVSLPLSFAQDWTRFRGPNGTGVVEGVSFPNTWTEKDYAWQIDLPGIGQSSPVVFGDKVFLLSADPQSALRHVLAIDLKSGEILWRKDYESSVHKLHNRNSFGSSTPAVDDQAVYVAWSSPTETILKAISHDGKELWTRDLGSWVSQHGFGTSPIVVGDRVVLFNSQQKDQLPPDAQPGQSRMMAFEASSGKTLWESPTNTTRVCYSVPCVRKTPEGGIELVCCNTGNGIFGMDLDTGKITWELPVFTQRCVASPVVAGDLVLGSCGSGGGGNVLVAVKAGENPKEVFRVEASANYVPTPLVYNDLVFLFGDKGIVSCVDMESGKSLWRERVAKGFSGSPICVSGKIYGMDEDGTMHVLSAAREFKQLGEVDLGETSRATPAVAGGMMLLRSDSRLRALPAH